MFVAQAPQGQWASHISPWRVSLTKGRWRASSVRCLVFSYLSFILSCRLAGDTDYPLIWKNTQHAACLPSVGFELCSQCQKQWGHWRNRGNRPVSLPAECTWSEHGEGEKKENFASPGVASHRIFQFNNCIVKSKVFENQWGTGEVFERGERSLGLTVSLPTLWFLGQSI